MEFDHISVKERVLMLFDLLVLLFLTYVVVSTQFAPALSYLFLKVLSVLFVIRLAHDVNFEMPEKIIFLLIAAFLIIQFMTSLTSSDPRQSITVLKIRVYYYAVFFAAILFIKTAEHIKAVLTSLIIITSIVSVIEICRFLFDISALNISPSESRIGYFGHPVTSAEIKMLVILIIFPLLFLKEKFLLSRTWLVILSVPVFVSFFFAYARGAFIALFSGIILIGILKSRKIVYGAVIFLLFYFLIIPDSVNKRMLSFGDRSAKARVYMIETGIQIAKDNLLLGVGSIGLKDIYEKYRKITVWAEGEQLHNNVLQILVTTGIFGLLIWLALMIYIFKKLVEIYRQTKKDNIINALALSSLASMIAFQICGLTDWGFADYSFVAVFWLSLSLAFIAKKFYDESNIETIREQTPGSPQEL